MNLKYCSERSQIFHFINSDWNSVVSVVRDFILAVVKKDSVVSVVSEVKQRNERSQRVHFNSS